jgi:hypothetical protein
MKATYTATLPNGMIVSRKSDRVYTHIVAAICNESKDWVYLGFCGSLDLAKKLLVSSIDKGTHKWGTKYAEKNMCIIAVNV